MFISPMLLETASGPFNDLNYIFEPKIDGHRLILDKEGGKVRLFTRHETEVTRQYPELLGLAIDDVELDGEVACADTAGDICFETVMERFAAKRLDKVRRLAESCPVQFVVFDILRLGGRDLRGLPLTERKAILAGLHFGNPHIAAIPYIQERGVELFEQIKQQCMEGIVGKRADSLYVSRRSADWLKVINWQHTSVWISGYRKDSFGWLLQDESGRAIGVVEFGVSQVHKQAFRGVAKQLVIGEDAEFVYLEPNLHAQVKFRNWTKKGLLRSPVFEGFIF